ncbi:MAG TPA: chromosomal replication initiator protein DnaA [Rickettsiales bacterium]|nr:chromosomal replication initiator protein DnaA [Rickettsiales bacterium]
MQELEQNNIWVNVKRLFQNEFEIEVYNSWLSNLNFVSFNGFELTMSVETMFIKEWISKEFLDGRKKKVNGEIIWLKKGIKQLLLEQLNIKKVEIIVDKNVKSEAKIYNNNVANLSEHDNIFTIGTQLNPLYTFENYVVGNSNKLACSIAHSIINEENLGFSVNPFFIYGNVGLGKTHLMQAMAWEFKNKCKSKNVVYLSAEKFMYLFVQSLQNKNINEFKEQFRNIDILLIDDIQFIAGKEGTQKEFFYTFNTLLSDNKKIIMACDKAPENMENIDNQLKSRMSGGIVVDILAPDYEMRLELAKKKAEILGLSCDNEIFEYIAQNVTSTNRDIEGIIKKLLVHQKFVNQNITLDVVKNILKDIISANNKVITIQKIQQKVVDFYKITNLELLSDKRDRKFSLPRQVAFYLSKKITKKSFPEIGREFGNKNHATVIFAFNKIEKELELNSELAEAINKIEKSL